MFGATYRTIDIRSAAVKQGDAWVNVYAVARLSYEEPDRERARQEVIGIVALLVFGGAVAVALASWTPKVGGVHTPLFTDYPQHPAASTIDTRLTYLYCL